MLSAVAGKRAARRPARYQWPRMIDTYGLRKHLHFVEGAYKLIFKALQRCLSATFILLYLLSGSCSVPNHPDAEITASFHSNYGTLSKGVKKVSWEQERKFSRISCYSIWEGKMQTSPPCCEGRTRPCLCGELLLGLPCSLNDGYNGCTPRSPFGSAVPILPYVSGRDCELPWVQSAKPTGWA